MSYSMALLAWAMITSVAFIWAVIKILIRTAELESMSKRCEKLEKEIDTVRDELEAARKTLTNIALELTA